MRSVITPLRVVLILFLLGLVLSQIFLPSAAQALGGQFWETAHLVVPYAMVGILAIAAVELAVLMIWILIGQVGAQRIFRRRSLHEVEVIIACMVAATLLPAGAMMHLLIGVGVGGPGIVLMLAACLVTGAAATLLMVVMRGLLRTAIQDRTELDGVI